MYDDLARIEAIYGCVAEYNRCMEERDYEEYEPTEEEIAEMKQQVACVKQIRSLTQQGRFTRLASPFEGTMAAWQFANEDCSEIVAFLFRRFNSAQGDDTFIRLRDVDETCWYEDANGKRYHGSALKYIGLMPDFDRMPDAASQVFHLKKVD